MPLPASVSFGKVVAAVVAAAIAVVSVPAFAQAGGQEINATAITPTLGFLYDSNVFQLNDQRFAGDRSDTVVSPGVAASISRTIGRNSLSLAVNGGYDIHQRYKTLDQVNVTGAGQGKLALTGACLVSATGAVTVQQNNLSGVAAIKNSQAIQNYAGTVSCRRPFGLYPSATLSYQSVTNSQSDQSLFNQHALSLSGGVGYALPTIGSLLLSVGEAHIRQPNRADIEGEPDGSDVVSAGLTFERSVAPRLSFSLGGRYLSVDPLRSTVPGYAGPGYTISIDYHPSPRVSLVATALRDVVGSGDVAVSYVLTNSYGLTGTLNLSTRTSVHLTVQRFDRDYRGESVIYFPVPHGYERGEALTGSASHLLGRIVQLRIFSTYTTLDSQGIFYDFNRFQLGVSAGARF